MSNELDIGPAPPTVSGDRVLFYAVLYPNRSLSPRGFLIVMGIFAGASLLAGLFFLSSGAWPIAGFYGLDVVLLYVLFRLSYRSGRVREIVRITGTETLVQRHVPGRPMKEWRFQTYWVRLSINTDADEEDCRIVFSVHDRSVTVGAFLSPKERLDLAQSLQNALADARRI